MSRRHGRRGAVPRASLVPACGEPYHVVLPFAGDEKRRFFNQVSDQVVVVAGVAAVSATGRRDSAP